MIKVCSFSSLAGLATFSFGAAFSFFSLGAAFSFGAFSFLAGCSFLAGAGLMEPRVSALLSSIFLTSGAGRCL